MTSHLNAYISILPEAIVVLFIISVAVLWAGIISGAV